MKKKLSPLMLIVYSLLVFVFTSCDNNEKPEDTTTINIKIKSGELFTYNTNAGGDEEGASITTQAANYEVSEIIRNEGTNFIPIYNYKSKPEFKGKDYVEIYITHNLLSSSVPGPGDRTIKINLVVE